MADSSAQDNKIGTMANHTVSDLVLLRFDAKLNEISELLFGTAGNNASRSVCDCLAIEQGQFSDETLMSGGKQISFIFLGLYGESV